MLSRRQSAAASLQLPWSLFMQQFQTPEYEHEPSPESHMEPLPAQGFIQEFQINQYTHDP